MACAGSALLYASLFPPFDLGALAPFALAPYLWAIAGARPWVAAALGAWFGTLGTLGVIWWLPRMLAGYFDLGPFAAQAGLVGVALLLIAPFQAAFAAWLAWRWQRGAPSVITVGAAWALVEFARSHAPIADPVGLLAYGASDPLLQLADLAGPWGLGALFAACAAALARLAIEPHAAGARRAALGAGIALGLALLYGAWRLAQPFDAGEPVRVALVQGAVVNAHGWDRGASATHLERHLELTHQAAAFQPALVFWPEFAVDFYLRESTVPGARLRAEVRALGVDLVTGANDYTFEDGQTRYYNSVFVVDHRGRIGGRYDKMELMPFAESAPLGERFSAAGPSYTPGELLRPLVTASGRVGAFLCGEALFPEVARELARSGAELLANPTNDHWFGAPAGAEQHLRAARMRAVENRRWLVRPTTTGVSAVIDPRGRVVTRSAGQGPELLTATVQRSQSVTPVQRWGDAPLGAALAIVLFSSLRGAHSTRLVREGDPG